MRTTILMTPVLALLAAGVAHADYLGKNPGANVGTASQTTVQTPVHTSGQGGYLGMNAGENQPSASQDPVKPPPEFGSGQGGYLGSVPGSKR